MAESEHDDEEDQDDELEHDEQGQLARARLRHERLQLAVKFDHLHLIFVHLVPEAPDDRRLGLELRVDVLALELDRLGDAVDLVELLLLLAQELLLLEFQRLGGHGPIGHQRLRIL